MASSDNLMTMEQPWAFRPTFTDDWISDIYAKETEAVTKALQRSLAGDGDGGAAEPFSSGGGIVESLIFRTEVSADPTPTASGCSENEVTAPVSKPRRGLPPAGGRVAKRKSRASKRSTTTFIAADAANFRQMVQQVTGVRFAGMGTATQLLKPEPQRAVDRLQMSGVLPTFDTSAFLLDASAPSAVAQPPAAAGGSGLEFDPFCSFPTLESWKVV